MAIDTFTEEAVRDIVLGGALGAIIALGIIVILLIVLAIYIYTSLAWYTIATKLNHKKAWLAWIPVARWAMILQLGQFNWAWIFLILIPIAGWIALVILLVISSWRIYEMRGYPGWLSLAIIIPQIGFVIYLILIGFVAWSDRDKPVKKKK